MAKAFSEWTVLGHEPRVELADNLFWVRGTLPGMSLKRVMTVVRLSDGGLLIHNAIALEEAAMQELEALGTPRYLIVPSGIHRLDAPAYKRRYPALRVFAPRGSRAKVEQVIAVDGSYEDFPNDPTISLQTLGGMNEVEGAMLVRSKDGLSVVLNDAVFNMDRKRDPLGFLFTTLLGSAPGPRISRLAKLMLIKGKAALRTDLEKFASMPGLQRLIVAHENVATGPAAAEALRKAAAYL